MPPSMANVTLAARQKDMARDRRLVFMVVSGAVLKRCDD